VGACDGNRVCVWECVWGARERSWCWPNLQKAARLPTAARIHGGRSCSIAHLRPSIYLRARTHTQAAPQRAPGRQDKGAKQLPSARAPHRAHAAHPERARRWLMCC
jgi:hypothetical protein